MADQEPEAAGAVRSFYASYWNRVRSNLWGDVHENVVPVLLGRFKHAVYLCSDGVLVVMHRASTDSFAWKETSRKAMELVQDRLTGTSAWTELEVGEILPGEPNELDFDLDVALPREEEKEQLFDRLQLRYVPFDRDYAFWTPANADRLAARNLGGPIE